MNHQNPTAGIYYDYLAHQESLSINWSPKAVKGWDFQGNYTRSSVRSDINYLIPQVLTPERDLYKDNNHSATLLLNGNLPTAFGVKARLSAGGSSFVSSGSRPTSYYQPFAKLTVPVNRQMAWVSEWRYYGFGETFPVFENFRTHLITTGSEVYPMIRLLVLAIVPACAMLAQPLPADSVRGERLFESEHCIECHAVNGIGGHTAPDLGRALDRDFSSAKLASTMWNHAPTMWSAMRARNIQAANMDDQAAADLFAYFYAARFFEKPGDAGQGKRLFTERSCARCHGITAALHQLPVP